MNNNLAIALGIGVLLLGGLIYFSSRDRKAEVVDGTPQPSMDQPEYERPTDEEAELVAFGFIQDFIASAPPDPDAEAANRAYEALSERARLAISQDTISRDLAGFIGVQDVPDQGASVEDLQVSGDIGTLIVGLNFSGGRTLRAVNVVVENGVWKVDSVKPLEQYPPQ